MALKLPEVARYRLASQGISTPARAAPASVVKRLVAVQAQDYSGAKWALGLRLQDTSEAEVERAFNSGSILRTHILRPTWHFVTPEDIGWLLELTAPHVHRLNASIYLSLELNTSIFEHCNHVLAAALENRNHLTRNELGVSLTRAGIEVDNRQRLAYILMQAELNGLICSGGRRGKQFTYALLSERAAHARQLPRDHALAELVQRYFSTRGPATLQDFCKWSGLSLKDARPGLESIKAELQQDTLDGKQYWFAPQASPVPEVSARAWFLSVYDEMISSYKDHSPIAPAEVLSKMVTLGNAIQNIILLGGQIVGTWRREIQKERVVIECTLYASLSPDQNQAVIDAALQYGQFLRMPVEFSPLVN